MFEIKYSRQSKLDLKEIWLYIAYDSQIEADKYIKNIRDKILNLIDYPELGREVPEIGLNYRLYVIGRHKVYYKIQNKAVKILRIYHSKRKDMH